MAKSNLTRRRVYKGTVDNGAGRVPGKSGRSRTTLEWTLCNLEKAPGGTDPEKSCGLRRGSLGGPARKGKKYLPSPTSPTGPAPISCPGLPTAELSGKANGEGAHARRRWTRAPGQSQVGEWRAGPEGLMEGIRVWIPAPDPRTSSPAPCGCYRLINLPVKNVYCMKCRWFIDKDRTV